jgi:hypothetical protein
LNVGTVIVSVRFINFFLVKTLAVPGIHSFQANRFGSEIGDFGSVASLQNSHTVEQCSHFFVLGPDTQNSSDLQPQQVISTFFSSRTSRQTFLQLAVVPHRSHPSAKRFSAIVTINIIADKAATHVKRGI